MKHSIEYITVLSITLCTVPYITVFNTFFSYSILYCIICFIGQRHLALLRFRVDGSGIGALAGGELPDLPPEGQRPQDLGPPSVSIIQYGAVQYSKVLPYLILTISNLHEL